MIRKTMSIISLACCVMALPSSAIAHDIDLSEDYAYYQCGASRWMDLGYSSYQDCYNFAVYYYYLQVPGGRGTFLGDLPGYTGQPGCGSRLCGDTPEIPDP